MLSTFNGTVSLKTLTLSSYALRMQSNVKNQRSIIIPYYNEAKRFPIEMFICEAKIFSNIKFILVDDGSTDGLSSQICELIKIHELKNIFVFEQEQNLGKAAALHLGFLHCFKMKSSEIGYLDADFATSIKELIRLFDILDSTGADAVIGNRESTGDNSIVAKRYRLIAGRLFSTFVRLYFRINLIDTQCGAKVFRANNILIKSLQQPIINPWLYDLQLLVPIMKSGGTVIEASLKKWENSSESKFSLFQGLLAIFRLRRIKVAINKSLEKT